MISAYGDDYKGSFGNFLALIYKMHLSEWKYENKVLLT